MSSSDSEGPEIGSSEAYEGLSVDNLKTLQAFSSATLESDDDDEKEKQNSKLSRRQRRRMQQEEEETEATLTKAEQARRSLAHQQKHEEEDKGPAPLPIKMQNKLLPFKPTPKEELRKPKQDHHDKGEEEKQETDNDDDSDAQQEQQKPMSKRAKKEERVAKQQRAGMPTRSEESKEDDTESLPPTALLALRKEEIASTCSSVMESPETRIKKLHHVVDLCQSQDRHIMFAVRKIAIASLTTVFKDIIPGYRIRAVSDKEQTQRVSKEVKEIRDFEAALLKTYQAFLQTLNTCIKDLRQARRRYAQEHGQVVPARIGREEKEMKRLASTAVLAAQSLCQLLEYAPHFNYRNNIITVITPLMTGAYGTQLARITTNCAIQVFKEDQAYDVSLALAKAIAQEIKTRSYNVDPQMVTCLRFLKIKERHVKAKKRDAEEDAEKRHKDKYTWKKGKKAKKAAQAKTTRREKKDLKAEKQLSKELMARETEANVKKLEHNQTQILKVVFAVYFRVLKHARMSPVLPTVLEGIAHFAHLIDVAVFFDLMEVLKEVISSASLPPPVTITAISTAMTLLAEEHTMASIDPTHFLTELFAHMNAVVFHPELMPHILSCLYLLLIRRKEVSIERVAGLLKRLLALCAHLPHHSVVAAQALMRDVVRKYPRVAPMLENDTVASGMYNPLAALPEHSNALASALWEGALFQRHYHPHVRMFNKHILAGAPITGIGRLPPQHVKATYKEYLRAMAPTPDIPLPFVPDMESLYRRPNLAKKSKVAPPAADPVGLAELEKCDFAAGEMKRNNTKTQKRQQNGTNASKPPKGNGRKQHAPTTASNGVEGGADGDEADTATLTRRQLRNRRRLKERRKRIKAMKKSGQPNAKRPPSHEQKTKAKKHNKGRNDQVGKKMRKQK